MNLPPRYTRLLLATVLLAGASLRFYGLDWGTDQQTGTFHTFHPDELTLVEGARLVATDLRSLPTAYAKFPSYLLYAAARISGSILGLDLLNTENNSTVRALHLFARYLSATLGTLTLVLVFLIGKRLAGPGTALLATTLLAFSPGHIQQSHYYTVDVAFTCWTVLALYFMIQMPSPNLRPYLAAGLATGLAAGTRLLGGLLCVPFLVAHLFPARGVLLPFRTRLQTCFSQRAFLCAGIVLLLVFLCAPYLILDPARFFSDADMRNFKPSAEIARGERIRIWNLYDFSTTPYLFYFTHLFRYALGLPLELAGLAGLGLALRRRNPQALILLCWFAAYLALVGGLHTRPIRYATPVLPVLILLGAWACVEIGRRFSTHRILAALPALLVTFPTLALGLSTVRVYHIEDARIQAARWIQQNIPQGENIYVERGGFPTAWMAPSDQYRQIVDGASFFINVGGGMLYSAEAEVIVKKLKAAQWIVLIEENRMQQYRAVPDRYPVAFSFYSRLNAGTLGYEQMAEFKVSPGLGPWTWDPSDADPTVTAYDHPHVRIFKRRPDLEIDTHLENWVSSIRSDPSLPDAVLLKGVQAYEQGQLDEAALAFRKTVKIRPSLVLGHVLLHATYLRQGHHQEAKQTWQKVLHHTGPQLIQTSISLYQLGMDAEAIAFMEQAAQASEPDRLKFRNAFLDLAEILYERENWPGVDDALTRALAFGELTSDAWRALAQARLKTNRLDSVREALQNALRLNPELDAGELFLTLGSLYYNQGNEDQAETIYFEALQNNANLAEAYYNLGILYLNRGISAQALQYLRDAVRLAPQDWKTHQTLGVALFREGRTEEARTVFQQALRLEPNNTETKAALEHLSQP